MDREQVSKNVNRHIREISTRLNAISLTVDKQSEPDAVPDDPANDGTDAAHPAWWRGEMHGSRQTTRLLRRALDKPSHDTGMVAGKELESLKQRIQMIANAWLTYKEHYGIPVKNGVAMVGERVWGEPGVIPAGCAAFVEYDGEHGIPVINYRQGMMKHRIDPHLCTVGDGED